MTMTSMTRSTMALLSCLLVALLGGCRDRDRAEAAGFPQRIVSQTVVSDEILWELGDDVRRRVVGVSRMADDPTYSGVAGVWPSSVSRVPGSSEALVAVRPDLVVLAEFTAAETKALLEHSGVATLELEGFDGFSAFSQHVRLVADSVGAPQQGEALVARFDQMLATHRVSPEPGAPTVVSWVEGMVAGADTTFDDQVRAAGLVNAAARHGVRGHRAVPIEQLTTWDPDIIVISCQGDCDAARLRTLATPGIAATKAAREGRLLPLQSRLLYSTGLGMIEVVKALRDRERDAR
jgi:ABC-type hemin transport system substrate-binding protein